MKLPVANADRGDKLRDELKMREVGVADRFEL